MTCAWKELLDVLPMWMRDEVDQLGAEHMRELRLRMNSPPELVFLEKSIWLERYVSQEDIHFTVNAASRYSPWAAASMSKGYICITGGHRIGLCGDVVVQHGSVTGLKNIRSLCIRVAREYKGIAAKAARMNGSLLVLGPPGWGKTTFLRDLIHQKEMSERICVVDERRELLPEGLSRGKRVDVLSGCSKQEGISMALRTMGPSCIAVDEITDAEDCNALIHASNCGVSLLATAHAASVSDLKKRKVYRPLVENHIFDVCLVLDRENHYTVERTMQWATNGSVRY